MSRGPLGLSFGVTLLALCEQRGTCVLLAANLNPKLPETVNKGSFNVSLVKEVWGFLPLLIEQVVSENFARAGGKVGL